MARKKRPPSYGILLVPLVGILILTLTLVILYAMGSAYEYYYDWQIKQRIAQIPNVDMEKSNFFSWSPDFFDGPSIATEIWTYDGKVVLLSGVEIEDFDNIKERDRLVLDRIGDWRVETSCISALRLPSPGLEAALGYNIRSIPDLFVHYDDFLAKVEAWASNQNTYSEAGSPSSSKRNGYHIEGLCLSGHEDLIFLESCPDQSDSRHCY